MTRKLPKKNRNFLVPILLVLFTVSLLYTGYKHYGPFKFSQNLSELETEPIPEYFDFGDVSENTYCNDFFNFRVPIFKGHEARYKIYDYIEKSLYDKDSILAVPLLASEVFEQDLLIIQKELVKVVLANVFEKTASFDDLRKYSIEKDKREFYGPDYSLVISAYNLSGKPLSTYSSRFSNMHLPYSKNPQTKTISGIEFRKYEGVSATSVFSIFTGIENKNIISFMTEMNGFALDISLFYKTEEQKCILLDIVNEISFH